MSEAVLPGGRLAVSLAFTGGAAVLVAIFCLVTGAAVPHGALALVIGWGAIACNLGWFLRRSNAVRWFGWCWLAIAVAAVVWLQWTQYA